VRLSALLRAAAPGSALPNAEPKRTSLPSRDAFALRVLIARHFVRENLAEYNAKNNGRVRRRL